MLRIRPYLFTMLSETGAEDDNFPPCFLGIPHRCRRPAAPLPIVDSQQQTSGLYQLMVPIKHTPAIIFTAHIVHRIGLAQNKMIPFLC